MCTRISGQGSFEGNKQFALDYLVSVLLVGIFLGGMSQGNPLGDLVHVYCFVKGNLYLRGAVVEWLEQLGYGAESRRIA